MLNYLPLSESSNKTLKISGWKQEHGKENSTYFICVSCKDQGSFSFQCLSEAQSTPSFPNFDDSWALTDDLPYKFMFLQMLVGKVLSLPLCRHLSASYIIKLFPSGNSHFVLHKPWEWKQTSAKPGNTALALPLLSMEEQKPQIHHSDHLLWFTDVFTCCLSSSFSYQASPLPLFTCI